MSKAWRDYWCFVCRKLARFDRLAGLWRCAQCYTPPREDVLRLLEQAPTTPHLTS